jgi:class 3 adenylate cyclase
VPLADDLRTELDSIFKSKWEERAGQKVPETVDLKLGSNDAVQLDATVLYADLAESTKLVDSTKWQFAAEVYKAYLACASRLILSEGGTVTAFDGDRVMAVFLGNQKNNDAARCALKINYAVREIINPTLKPYWNTDVVVRHAVGIDTGALRAARTGVRNSNDLVWVGRAANYAAKLCAFRTENYATWISSDVYGVLAGNQLTSQGTNMWEAATWSEKGLTVYRSKYQWPF